MYIPKAYFRPIITWCSLIFIFTVLVHKHTFHVDILIGVVALVLKKVPALNCWFFVFEAVVAFSVFIPFQMLVKLLLWTVWSLENSFFSKEIVIYETASLPTFAYYWIEGSFKDLMRRTGTWILTQLLLSISEPFSLLSSCSF